MDHTGEDAGLLRSVERSWLLHRRLAEHLDLATLRQWTPRILVNIEQARGLIRGEPHTSNLEHWAELVAGEDVTGLHIVLTGLDEASVQMREVSPLRGLLTEAERAEALLGSFGTSPAG